MQTIEQIETDESYSATKTGELRKVFVRRIILLSFFFIFLPYFKNVSCSFQIISEKKI